MKQTLSSILLLVLTSCYTNYDLELSNSEPQLVVDGWTITDFVGVAGRTYQLQVEVITKGQSNFYSAETTMLTTPTITAIDYEIRKGPVGKSNQFVPLISFHEPADQRNYYLFSLCETNQISYVPVQSWQNCNFNNRVWNFSILPDTFLPEQVNKLSVDDGGSPTKGLQFYPPVYLTGDGTIVLMYAIDEVTYKYYKSMIAQYDYDGGAYFPTPSTPPGNISNGALGLFTATQVTGAAVFLE